MAGSREEREMEREIEREMLGEDDTLVLMQKGTHE
jgi:hypothetical protein